MISPCNCLFCSYLTLPISQCPLLFNTNMLLCSYFSSCRENEFRNRDLLIRWSYRATSNTAQDKIFELAVPHNSRTTMTHTRRKKKPLPDDNNRSIEAGKASHQASYSYQSHKACPRRVQGTDYLRLLPHFSWCSFQP